MKITYTKCGDYLLPNLILKPRKQESLNKYGLMDKLYNHLFQSVLMQKKKLII